MSDSVDDIPVDNPPRAFWVRVLRALFRPKPLITLAALVSAVIFWPMVRANLPDLSEHEDYRLDPSQISVNAPPHWVPHNFVANLQEGAGFPDNMSLLDENLTVDIAKRFARYPWVADVKSVRKESFPPCVLVELEYRRPIAMIQKRTGFYPIDAKGVLLPKEDFSLSQTANYLIIQGVRSSPPSLPGERWDDALLLGATRIAAALRQEQESFNLKAVIVPPRMTEEVKLEDAEFTLLTNSGSTILWGRAPGVTRDKELSVEQKIERLQTYLSDYGSFEAPAGPYEIDIRHWQQISRRQIPAVRDAKLPNVSIR